MRNDTCIRVCVGQAEISSWFRITIYHSVVFARREMNPPDLQRYFLDLIELLRHGRVKPLLALFDFPVVVYRHGRPRVIQTEQEMDYFLNRYREARLRRVPLDVRPVLSFELPHTGSDRTPILVDWVFSDADAQEVGRSQVRYYANFYTGRPRIEMVEFLEIAALPQLALTNPSDSETKH